MSLPAKLKNFNLFNEGHSYVGRVTEVTLPKLTVKTEEFRAGGMDMPVSVDLGQEKLTLEWKLGGIETQVFQQFGLTKINGIGLRFAGALENDDTAEVKNIEIVVRGRHSEIDTGSAKSGDDTEMTITSELTYYKLSIDGKPIIEIDALAMKKIVDGKDLLATKRTALGI